MDEIVRGNKKHVPKLLTLTRRGTPSGRVGHVIRLVGTCKPL